VIQSHLPLMTWFTSVSLTISISYYPQPLQIKTAKGAIMY
jgi:ethanolamine-phosphate phospho-lyase